MPPFGSPKRERQHDSDEAKRRRRSVGRLIDRKAESVPVSIGIGAGVIVGRSGFRRCMDGPVSPASVPTPAALREVRLNGFPGALAEVRRHRVDGGGRRVPNAAPTGFSDARFVVQPAYSLGPHSVSPLRRLAGGCAPSDPRNGNGAPWPVDAPFG